jgi:hypothetical protein
MLRLTLLVKENVKREQPSSAGQQVDNEIVQALSE